jgi:poly(A) polymerase
MSDTPVGKLSRAAWMDSPETLKLMLALCGDSDDNGDEARFVGGCVRDVILNYSVFDIDIATSHSPEEVMRRLKNAKIKAIPTGIEHGTITAVVDGVNYEITTLRRDVETDGRHAVVAFTDNWKEDARRRDFTMNALYCNIRGDIYDYFDGLEDARQGIVRFIDDPTSRIDEDVLRILRFYRFHAHYGKADPVPEARAACRNGARDLTNLSAERIRIEILKLLQAANCAVVWRMMAEDGILDIILKSARDTANLEHLVRIEQAFEGKSYIPRRLASLIGFDAEAAEQIAAALKLSNADRKTLIRICDPKARLDYDTPAPQMRQEIYRHGIEDVLNRLLMTAAIDKTPVEKVTPPYHLIIRTRLPRLPVNGDDLIERGLKPGPDFGQTLKAVEQWWLDEDFEPGRTACLKKLDELIAG